VGCNVSLVVGVAGLWQIRGNHREYFILVFIKARSLTYKVPIFCTRWIGTLPSCAPTACP